MSIATAPLLAEAGTISPPRFGLLSVAQIVDTADQHWVDGVTYPLPPSPTAVIGDVDCNPDTLTLGNDIPWTSDSPVRVIAGVAVKKPGWDEGEISAHARGALTAGEGPALETGLWPGFVNAADTPANNTAQSILTAIGVLEEWLYDTQPGAGVLHVARSAVGHLVRARQIREVNGQLQTPLGTLVSAGAYPGTGPAGVAAAAGTVWVAATPAVRLRRTPIRVQESFNHRSNKAQVVADRIYVPSWDNASAAALVQLETV